MMKMKARITTQITSYWTDPRSNDHSRNRFISYTRRRRRTGQFAIRIPGIIVADNQPVTHFDKTIGIGDEFGIVSNQNDGLAESAIQFPKHIQNDLGVP